MRQYIRQVPPSSPRPPLEERYQVVVAGGGMSGLLAAMAAARGGARTCLVHDRSVLGGNASSETRMHISGASCHWGKRDAAETGILMELQLCNKYLNDSYNYSIWDGVLWSAAMNTPNLTCYLNATLHQVNSDGRHIQWVDVYQMTTEKHLRLIAPIFIDCTGHGTLGDLAGAEYCVGRESGAEYGEPHAPRQWDGETMGNTLYFVAQDVGHAVKFVRPPWAHTFDESDFAHRYHGDIVVYHDAEDVVVLRPDEDYADHADQLVEKYDVQSGYWWIELGGDWDDIIAQAEDIRYELYRCVYGVWDHIKNGGDHGADNYQLVWVGNVSGTRESRRLLGDYVLTENDILANRVFADGVAYGGWPMDEHTAGGLRAKGQIPSKVRSFEGLYSIPYGCYLSRTIDNLMMAGRDISATKLAMGSTRVMGTCAVGGQAVGIAAAMAAAMGLSPRALGKNHMQALRQALLKEDLYVPGLKNEDPLDLARRAKVSCMTQRPGFEAENVLSGVTRREGERSHLWVSRGIAPGGETLALNWDQPVVLRQLRLTFDPNLSEERCISVSKAFIDKEPVGVAAELVRDYHLRLSLAGEAVWQEAVSGNYQRLRVHVLPQAVKADRLEIAVDATNGAPDARLYEVRAY